MGIGMGDEPVFTGRVVVKLGRKQGWRRIHRDKKGLIAITDCLFHSRPKAYPALLFLFIQIPIWGY